MRFKILKINDKYIEAIVQRGGIIRAEKGVNAPNLKRDNLRLTEKDKRDITWGIEKGVSIICLSFVTSKEDMLELKNYVALVKNKLNKSKKIELWAKIECREGLKNFKDILECSDGIMLGRGDLKGEVSISDIPLYQKNIINIMKRQNKPLIIGTYLLDSMKRGDPPSLAEVNDLYYFIKNSVDGFMLSTEITICRKPDYIIRYLGKLMNKYENIIK